MRDRTSMWRKPLALSLLALSIFIFVRFALVESLRASLAPDFAINYTAAHVLREGGSVYDRAVLQQAHLKWIGFDTGYEPLYQGTFLTYINPPTTALLMYPLSFLTFSEARIVFLLINSLIYVVASLVLAFSLTGTTYRFESICLCLTFSLASLPLMGSLTLGQMDALVIGLLTLAFLALLNGHDIWAGILIIVAASIKISPALLLGIFWVNRRWVKGLIGAAVASVTILVVSVMAIGLSSLTQFITVILSLVSRGSANFQNQSVLGALYRLFTPASELISYDSVGDYPIARLLWIGTAILLVLFTLLFALRARSTERNMISIVYGGFIVVALLIGSVVWDHYMTWLMIPVTALVADWFTTRWLRGTLFWPWLTLVMLGVNFPTILQLRLYGVIGPLITWLGTLSLFALLMLVWRRLWVAANQERSEAVVQGNAYGIDHGKGEAPIDLRAQLGA